MRIVSLVAKGKLVKTSKSREIFWEWLSEKFTFTLYVFMKVVVGLLTFDHHLYMNIRKFEKPLNHDFSFPSCRPQLFRGWAASFIYIWFIKWTIFLDLFLHHLPHFIHYWMIYQTPCNNQKRFENIQYSSLLTLPIPCIFEIILNKN